MDFKKKIEEAQHKIESLKSDVAEMVGLAEAENRDLTDEESLQLTSMGDEIEKAVKRVQDLENAEKALGMKVMKAKQTGPGAPAVVGQRGFGKEREKGDLIFKKATAAFLAHVEKKTVQQVISERYPHDEELGVVVKTAVAPAMTDVAGWAQELTDEATRGFNDLLRGESVAAQLFGRAGIQLSFDGMSAIKIPGRAGTTTDLAPSWTGEGDAIPVKRGTTSANMIYPYKWGVISTFSKELAARSIPQIESLIRQFMLQDAGTQLDANFFNSDALVSGVHPAGILNGVTGTAAATGGTPAEDMTADLKNLVSPIMGANLGRDLVICMNPTNALAMSSVLTATGVYLFRSELASGQLSGIPVIKSTNIPDDVLIAIDCAQLAVAQSAPEFEVNDTATLVEYNDDGTAPSMTANTHPRSPNSGTVDAAVTAADAASGLGPVRSLFQTYAIALRMVQFLSWQTQRAGGVNQITGVSY